MRVKDVDSLRKFLFDNIKEFGWFSESSVIKDCYYMTYFGEPEEISCSGSHSENVNGIQDRYGNLHLVKMKDAMEIRLCTTKNGVCIVKKSYFVTVSENRVLICEIYNDGDVEYFRPVTKIPLYLYKNRNQVLMGLTLWIMNVVNDAKYKYKTNDK